MKLNKTDWYLILLALVIFTLIGPNELGFGAVALLPGLLLAYWLMTKGFQR